MSNQPLSMNIYELVFPKRCRIVGFKHFQTCCFEGPGHRSNAAYSVQEANGEEPAVGQSWLSRSVDCFHPGHPVDSCPLRAALPHWHFQHLHLFQPAWQREIQRPFPAWHVGRYWPWDFQKQTNCKKHQLAETNGTRLYDYVYMGYSLVGMLDAVTISCTHVPRSVGLLRFQTLWKTQPPLLQTIQVLVSVYYLKICETDVPFLLGIRKHASKCPAYTVFAVALLCPMWCGSDCVPSNAAMDQTINDRSMCGSLEAKNCWSSPKLSPFKFVELSNCNSGLRIRYCWSKTLWVLDIPMLLTGKFRSWAKYTLLNRNITVHTVQIIFICSDNLRYGYGPSKLWYRETSFRINRLVAISIGVACFTLGISPSF